jgi:hypothetical protein
MIQRTKPVCFVLHNIAIRRVDKAPGSPDFYEAHFGPSSSVISEAGRAAVDQKSWASSREVIGKLGLSVISVPTSPGGSPEVLRKPDVCNPLYTLARRDKLI